MELRVNIAVSWDIYDCIDCRDSTYFLRKWQIGSCYGNYPYESSNTYIESCCLLPAQYTLSCWNDDPYNGNLGWGNAAIEIQGQKYCDDFIGRKAHRKVSILGQFQRR